MKWSWTLGRLFGIRLRMHWTFLLLLLWIGFIYGDIGGLEAAIRGILFVLAVFACVVLHEYGHALTARRYGIATRDITLLPIGGVARLERMPSDPKQELLVAIAGPAVNVVIAAVLAAALWATGNFPRTVLPGDILESSFFANLMRVNLFIVAFNLLPAFPMDGGRVLRALLARRIDYVRATDIAAQIGQLMAILFAVAGLFVFGNIWLLFIAIFVYMGAEAEAQLVRTRVAIEDVPVRAAMMTRFRTLAPHDTLRKAADELLAGAQQDFPVVNEHGCEGLLLRRDLVRGLQEAGPESRVDQFLTPIPRVLKPAELLEDALNTMRSSECTSLPVADNGELLGLVTLENVGELIMVQTAVRGAAATPREPREPEDMLRT